jgi:two-component system NtrC family sensor kinase
VQPVFDTMIRSAVRLGEAEVGTFFRLENGMLHVGAHYNVDSAAEAEFRAAFPQPPSRDSIACRAIMDRAVVNTARWDDFSDAARKRVRLLGIQAAVAVPLLHNDVPIGAIAIGRRTPSVFSQSYVALLKTFAAQAVIAIENVRLFNETKEGSSSRRLSVKYCV